VPLSPTLWLMAIVAIVGLRRSRMPGAHGGPRLRSER
jgi:hypothetical protein